MIRYKTDIKLGLTTEQVNNRITENLVNYNSTPLTKSIKKIIISNIFTLFNFLNLFLGLAVFLTGSYKNLLFLFIILSNTLISTFQEIRSKKITDKLSLISDSKVKVIRNGKEGLIDKYDLVLDDIVIFKPGSQVVTDSIIVNGECEVNESCVTGESNNIYKKEGDMLLSGSFIITNTVICRVEHVGSNNYASIITKDAKYIKKANSELMNTLNFVIKFISIIIIPIGLLLFYNQYELDNNRNAAILNTVAALINMIPDGLVLLTSTVLAVSTIRLAKKKVLVQQLFCIETLARVDTLCIDKTGTITEGYMEVNDIIPINKDIHYIEDILSKMTSSLDNDNATMDALVRKYKVNNKLKVKNTIPFSSQYKYSAIQDNKTYILGAPSVLVKDKKINKQIEELSKSNRVVVLCETKNRIIDKQLPVEKEVLAIILLKDKIKGKAKETLEYFRKQDVDIKIISGDSPVTVSEIAKKVGLNNIQAVDLYDVEDSKIPDIVEKHNIFARVSPIQKKIIITSLKKKHTVAMIGDGINDVLALKEADCSIAMSSGTEAARNVSELVLLNSDFESIPSILNEGRQSINNIERSASLFLTKTLYASILAVLFCIINFNYPFLPIQLSLYNLVTIGLPSVILALEPNKDRIKPGNFLVRVLNRAIPTSITVVCSIILSIYMGSLFKIDDAQLSTISTIVLVIIGFRTLYKISYPFNKLRRYLFIALICLFLFLSIIFRSWFSLTFVNVTMILIVILISLIGLIIFRLVEKLFDIVERKINL